MKRIVQRRSVILLLGLGIALGCILGRPRSEPSYRGTSLSAWLEPTFHWTQGAYRADISPEFANAMQHMGTNTIPYLLRMIRSKDYVGTRYYLNWKFGMFADWLLSNRNDWLMMICGYNHPLVQRRRAVAGFKALGLLATNAVPSLLSIPLHSFSAGASESHEVIRNIGVQAFDIIAAQVQASDQSVKVRAILALERETFNPRREEVRAIWLKCLADSNPTIRRIAAYELGKAAPAQATAAISALEHLTNDADTNVLREVATALSRLKSGSEAESK